MRAGMLGTYHWIELQAEGYTLKAVPELGGQVIQLEKNGIPILHCPQTEQELAGASTSYGLPVLFPPNRIDGGHFQIEDREYQFPVNEPTRGNSLHGFLHTRPWTVEAVDETHLKMVFKADAQADFYSVYPHCFQAELEYQLGSDGLRQQITILNQGDKSMPVGLGFHSAFAAPHGTQIRVSVGQRILMNERMLPTGEVRELNSEEARLRAKGLSANAWSMDDHYTAKPLSLEEGAFHGAIIETADAMIQYEVDAFYQHWMIWNAGGQRDFICLEPQNWRVNAPNLVQQGMSSDEAGLTLLPAGKSVTARAFIRFNQKK